jgi:four helix bundle protein
MGARTPERTEPRDIQERTFAFAVRILKLVRALPRDATGALVSRQLARSGTSVGANVEEAQGSHSKADFARRMNIARAEAREANYWLRLIAETELIPRTRLAEILRESDELMRILVAIVKNTRQAR